MESTKLEDTNNTNNQHLTTPSSPKSEDDTLSLTNAHSVISEYCSKYNVVMRTMFLRQIYTLVLHEYIMRNNKSPSFKPDSNDNIRIPRNLMYEIVDNYFRFAVLYNQCDNI
jgi:hypothetical protein